MSSRRGGSPSGPVNSGRRAGHTYMEREPKIEERPQQPYAGITGEAESEAEFRQAVDRSFPELFGWLRSHGIEPAGPPFIRYLELSGEGQPLRFELGAPTREEPAADGSVHAGTLPGGRYVTYLHV